MLFCLIGKRPYYEWDNPLYSVHNEELMDFVGRMKRSGLHVVY